MKQLKLPLLDPSQDRLSDIQPIKGLVQEELPYATREDFVRPWIRLTVRLHEESDDGH